MAVLNEHDPQFTVDDDTLVVAETFRLVENYEA
jgi:hypothetical protein